MKGKLNILLLAALLYSISANADCVTNQSGNVVCGAGQCEIDQFGTVYCAEPGGGAIKDRNGNVQCGVGYCESDALGKIWCSKKSGGGAKIDSHGKVKCLGGCAAGAANLCQEAQ